MPKVKTTNTNIRHCRCPQCPVQGNSECSKKWINSQDPEETSQAKLFCARGKSSCNDLNKNERCICPSCIVWDENNLDQTYYCLNGEAR